MFNIFNWFKKTEEQKFIEQLIKDTKSGKQVWKAGLPISTEDGCVRSYTTYRDKDHLIGLMRLYPYTYEFFANNVKLYINAERISGSRFLYRLWKVVAEVDAKRKQEYKDDLMLALRVTSSR